MSQNASVTDAIFETPHSGADRGFNVSFILCLVNVKTAEAVARPVELSVNRPRHGVMHRGNIHAVMATIRQISQH